MDSLRWTTVLVAAATAVVIVGALALIFSPGTPPAPNRYNGDVQSAALLRVPVTGIYPGGNAAGLNPNMQNPLASDPDAAARERRQLAIDFHESTAGAVMLHHRRR